MSNKKKSSSDKGKVRSKEDYISKKKEKLLKKKKRRKSIIRLMLFFIMIAAIGVYVALEQEIFNVESVKVEGNRIVKEEEIVLLSKVKNGDNIFSIKDSEIRSGVKGNGYIKEVAVSRNLPDEVVIKVREREGEYYQTFGESYFVIDSEGFVLEGRNNIDGMELFKVQGIDLENVIVGEIINDPDVRKIQFLQEFSELRENNTSGVELQTVDVTDMNHLTGYIGGFQIKLGDGTHLREKLNSAINIYSEKKLENESGYIDVGFQGNPVIYINKQVEVEKNADEESKSLSEDIQSGE